MAYLCLNIYFDAMDFSECHSEEVMFLLTFSVLQKDKENKTKFTKNI